MQGRVFQAAWGHEAKQSSVRKVGCGLIGELDRQRAIPTKQRRWLLYHTSRSEARAGSRNRLDRGDRAVCGDGGLRKGGSLCEGEEDRTKQNPRIRLLPVLFVHGFSFQG